MFDFFNTLLGWVEMIGRFFVSFVESLARMIQLVVVSLNLPSVLAPVLPGILGTAVIAVSAVLALRFLCLK